MLNAYINLKGNAKEALEFYKAVFGGETTMTTFKEGGMQVQPDEESLLMHGQLTAPNNFNLMVSDSPSYMGFNGHEGFSMSLSGDDEAALTRYWEKLAKDGKINQPFVKSPWGDTFGMLTDKFGIDWMVNVTKPKA